MSFSIKKGASRMQLVNFYKEWQLHNIKDYAKWCIVVQIICMTLLGFLDLLLFDMQKLTFVNYRLFSISALSSMAITLQVLQLKNSKLLSRFSSASLVLSGTLWGCSYPFFLSYTTTNSEQLTVWLGTLMVYVFGPYFLFKYWREQYLFQISAIILLAFLTVTNKTVDSNLYTLLIWANLASFFLAWLLRRDFVSGLEDRLEFLKMLMPPSLAKIAVVSGDKKAISMLFAPVNQPIVCLMADWRSFQKMTETSDAFFIQNLFETFYNSVINQLELLDPNGNYFFNWHADELFIVFYDPKFDKIKISGKAFEFAKILADKVFNEVSDSIGLPLTFDVSLSAGDGLLGLMGPKTQKKTTVAGKLPGITKRLQNEAKLLRIECKEFESRSTPIIVIDEEMCRWLGSTLQANNFSEAYAKTKDIYGHKFYFMKNVTSERGFKSFESENRKIKLLA